MDIVGEFAFPLPISVICELLGIPEENGLIQSFRIMSRITEAVAMNREELDNANAQIAFLDDYFRGLFDLRRRQPQDDLITSLVQAEFAGDQLTDQELAANIILLFVAGYETTSNLIGNSVLALHQNPSELARLRNAPALLSDAIDELLRYESSVQFTGRQVLEDLDLGGKRLQKGDFIIACVGAANRDPVVYEDPNRLDLGRKNIRHLSFGGGIHFCLGAQLARIELEVTIATFLRRFPHLHLKDIHHPNWRPTFVWRGLESLQASWPINNHSSP